MVKYFHLLGWRKADNTQLSLMYMGGQKFRQETFLFLLLLTVFLPLTSLDGD